MKVWEKNSWSRTFRSGYLCSRGRINNEGDDDHLPELAMEHAFEIRFDDATINPLFRPKTQPPEALPPVADDSTRRRYITFFVATMVGVVYVFAGCMGIAFARTRTGRSNQSAIEIVFAAPPLVVSLLPLLFAAGSCVVLWFQQVHNNAPKGPFLKRISASCMLLLVLSWSALFVTGPMPDPRISQDTRTEDRLNRGSCRLYKQGFFASVKRSEFIEMHNTCPSIAASPFFYALRPDFADQFDEKNMVAAINTYAPFWNEMTREPDYPFRSTWCKLLFQACHPESCLPKPPEKIFDLTWYSLNISDRLRMVNETITLRRAEEMLRHALAYVSHDKELHGHIETLSKGIFEGIQRAQQEWKHPPMNMSNMTAKQGPCLPRLSPLFSTSMVKKEIDNPEFYQCAFTRFMIVVATIGFLVCVELAVVVKSGPQFQLFCAHSRRRHSAQIGAFLISTMCGFLFVYGGSLLYSDAGSVYFKSVGTIYLILSVCIFSWFGFYLLPPTTQKKTNPDQGGYFAKKCGPCWNHPVLECLRNINNPTRPQYVIRILCTEFLEVVLQLGALLFPQTLDGEFIVVSVALIGVNACLMAGILHCFDRSPTRMSAMIGVEIMFDLFFAVSGLMRLASNLNLSLFEHLALIKPIMSLQVDAYDLFVLLQLSRYTFKSSSSGTFMRRKAHQRRKTKGRWCLCAVLWILPVALAAVSVSTLVRYLIIQNTCVATVGEIALCAKERPYFNVPYGIFGTPSCRFLEVTELACAHRNLTHVPNKLGIHMPSLERADLSHNPMLTSVPTDFGSLEMPSLVYVDVSHTGVSHLSMTLANSSSVQTLKTAHSPIETSIDWSNSKLIDLPSSELFYTTFSSTLQHLNISGNLIRGRLSVSFCRLQQLRSLDLSGNNITSLMNRFPKPECHLLSDLPHLLNLDARQNRIKKLMITKEVVSLRKNVFCVVNIMENPLRNVHMYSVSNDPHGSTISKIFAHIHWPLDTVREILIQVCTFKSLQAILPWPKAFYSVTTFRGIASIIRADLSFLSALTKLTDINLNHMNQLHGTFWPLARLVHLTHIDLSYNQLNGTLEPLVNMTNLRTLAAAHNQLVGTLEALRDLHDLKSLVLYENFGMNGTIAPICAQLNRSVTWVLVHDTGIVQYGLSECDEGDRHCYYKECAKVPS